MTGTKTQEKKENFWTLTDREFKKIHWPGRNEIMKQTVMVTVCALVLGAVIAYFDQLVKLVIGLLA